MRTFLKISGYLVALVVVTGIFELRCYVSAGHTPVPVKPSPGDPERPTGPLSLCNGKELIEQSDEECVPLCLLLTLACKFQRLVLVLRLILGPLHGVADVTGMVHASALWNFVACSGYSCMTSLLQAQVDSRPAARPAHCGMAKHDSHMRNHERRVCTGCARVFGVSQVRVCMRLIRNDLTTSRDPRVNTRVHGYSPIPRLADSILASNS